MLKAAWINSSHVSDGASLIRSGSVLRNRPRSLSASFSSGRPLEISPVTISFRPLSSASTFA